MVDVNFHQFVNVNSISRRLIQQGNKTARKRSPAQWKEDPHRNMSTVIRIFRQCASYIHRNFDCNKGRLEIQIYHSELLPHSLRM